LLGHIRALALAAVVLPVSAHAGPPFLTDDPEPTETKHWEVYAPLFEADGAGKDFEGAFGAEINYGAAKDVQLTVGLPAAYTHDATGWRWGAGDLEALVKYRFYNDESAGLQIAAFPGVTLPTASHGMGADRVTALLPIWAQKDFGKWSVFGGGGYAINPGAGNRDYWTGGVAVARQFGDKLLVGLEADRQGADSLFRERCDEAGCRGDLRYARSDAFARLGRPDAGRWRGRGQRKHESLCPRDF